MRRLLNVCARAVPALATAGVVTPLFSTAPAAPQAEATTSVYSSLVTSTLSTVFGSTVLCEEGAGKSNFLDDDEGSSDTASESVENAGGASSAPGDFDDLEHSKSFVVNEVNGVNVMLMTTLTGVPERERAAAGVQVMIDQGYHTMYIYSDDRNPSLSAVYQPGPEGHILRFAGSHRANDSATFELESQFNPSMVYAGKGTVKYRGDDFSSHLAVKTGQQGKQAEFSYHQRIKPGLSVGGMLEADMSRFSPYPIVTGLVPTLFGALASGDDTWLVKLAGGSTTGTVRLHSSCGVACKLGLGKEAAGAGQPSSIVTINASSDHKVGMSWSNTMFSSFSSTQMLTILSASFDHRNQQHAVGAQFQFHY